MNKFIDIWAQPRSGHTAVMNWIIVNLRLNNHPVHCTEKIYTRLYQLRDNYNTNYLKLFLDDFKSDVENGYYILNMENLRLDFDILNTLDDYQSFTKTHIKHNNRIIVIRDMFNQTASWLFSKFGDPTYYGIHLNKLIQSHYEYLDYVSNTDDVVINYNRWCYDDSYRANILAKIGLKNFDLTHEFVSNKGGGSSFDGLKFDSEASRMNTSNRWKHLVHDDFPEYENKFPYNNEYFELFHKMARNRDLHQLTESVFGKIEPLEYFKSRG